ncbi:MAG: hypothetical protein M3O77_05310 [Chloroflexota bacterium]|nr:hypothetical protein [Chloroflexota bacterium]
MAAFNQVSPLDPRRAAAATRLRRLKSTIIGLTAAIALGLWSSISAAASPAARAVPSTPPATVTTPADQGFFGNGSPQLGSSSDQGPVLRSQGS